MPRLGNGDYVLPAGNPVVSGTVISSNWANSTMDDIALALTNSLSRDGDGGMRVPLLFDDGSALAPGISWINEPSSGLYRSATNEFIMDISTSNIQRWTSDWSQLSSDNGVTWEQILTDRGGDFAAVEKGGLAGETLRWEPDPAGDASEPGIWEPNRNLFILESGTLKSVRPGGGPVLQMAVEVPVSLPGGTLSYYQTSGFTPDSTETICTEIKTKNEIAWTNASAPADMIFSTVAFGSLDLVERMRINSEGFVGIGDRSIASNFPEVPLDVLRGDDNRGWAAGVADISIMEQNTTPSCNLVVAATDAAQTGSASIVFANDLVRDMGRISVAMPTGFMNFSTGGVIGMVLDDNQNVGIQQSTPWLALTLPDTGGEWLVAGVTEANVTLTGQAACITAATRSSNGSASSFQSVATSQSSRSHYLVSDTINGLVGYLKSDSGAMTLENISDYRLKENILPSTYGLSDIMKLNPIHFNFKTAPDKRHTGFLAHEVQEVMEEAVTGERDGEQMQTMAEAKLIPVMVAAIQELADQIQELREFSGL